MWNKAQICTWHTYVHTHIYNCQPHGYLVKFKRTKLGSSAEEEQMLVFVLANLTCVVVPVIDASPPCLSCMTMTLLIRCWTVLDTLPLLYAASVFCIFKALFASVIPLRLFFFQLCLFTWCAKNICLLLRSKFFFLPPLSLSPSLKMDFFHYASQQSAASAHAANSKHTD